MTLGIGGWNACGVELRWKSTGLTSASVTVFVSPTTSESITPTTTTTQAPEENPPGLSTGYKPGTGFGVTLGVILAISGIGFWIRCGRKRRWKYGEKAQSELAETRKP